MSKVLEILKRAKLFLSLAASDIEKARAARRKWFAKLVEKGKQNPDDPDYQKYLAYRRQQYDVGQQILNTDTEALDAYLDDQANRQRRFIERLKQDPEKLEAFRTKKKEEDLEKLNKARQGNDLESKVLLFGRQVAFKRNDEKRKNDRKTFSEYEYNQKILNDVSAYVNKLRTFMYGPKESKLLSNLEFLVNEGIVKVGELKTFAPALSRSLSEIVNIIDNQLSQHKSQGTII